MELVGPSRAIQDQVVDPTAPLKRLSMSQWWWKEEEKEEGMDLYGKSRNQRTGAGEWEETGC